MVTRRSSIIGFLVLLVSGMTHSASVEAQEWGISASVDYSSGDYGLDEDTDILYAPLSLRYDAGPFRFKATASYIRIEGPGSVIGGGIPVRVDNPRQEGVTTEQGLGDTVLSVGYGLPYREGLPFVELTAKVKIPTADEEKLLGTGEVDYGLQMDLTHQFGNLMPMATVGYRVYGDPDDYELDDTFFGSVGLGYLIGSRASMGASVDYREPASEASDDQVELVPWVSWRMSDSWSVNAYGLIGFTDSSPDTGAGLMFSFGF